MNKHKKQTIDKFKIFKSLSKETLDMIYNAFQQSKKEYEKLYNQVSYNLEKIVVESIINDLDIQIKLIEHIKIHTNIAIDDLQLITNNNNEVSKKTLSELFLDYI